MESEEYDFPSKYRLTSIIILVGGIAALIMFFLSFIAPSEVLNLDSPMQISDFISSVTLHQEWALSLVIVDTIFICGYLAMFVGLWFGIRDLGEMYAGLSLLLGLFVALLDIVENAIMLALFKGIPVGWSPETSIFNILWSLNEFINIASYIAALMFGVQYHVYFRKDPLKLGVGYLFLVYAFIGFLAIVFTPFSIARALVFVIFLFTVAYMLWDEHDISDEDLLDLLRRENESTSDYIQ